MNGSSRAIMLGVGVAFAVVLLLLAFAASRPLWDPTADSGNDGRGQGQGQGLEDAPGQNKDKDKDTAKDKAKTPEVDIELQGTVEEATDAQGRPTFSMTVDGTTWELSAGPKHYWGDDNPLAQAVGRAVVVAGTHHEGESDLSVVTIDGTVIREPGKPPWAGGPENKPNKPDASEPAD